jgi:hypothetical protein
VECSQQSPGYGVHAVPGQKYGYNPTFTPEDAHFTATLLNNYNVPKKSALKIDRKSVCPYMDIEIV